MSKTQINADSRGLRFFANQFCLTINLLIRGNLS